MLAHPELNDPQYAAMHHLFTHLSKAVVLLVGFTALYCACFLYEDEEKRLQNRIEQFWIQVDERRRLSQPFALASKIAGVINRWLDRILGEKLISFSMFVTTSCFSMFALEVWETGLLIISMKTARIDHYRFVVSIASVTTFLRYYFNRCLYLLLAGIMSIIYPNFLVSLLALAVVIYVQYSGAIMPIISYGHEIRPYFVFFLSVLSDVICLAVVR